MAALFVLLTTLLLSFLLYFLFFSSKNRKSSHRPLPPGPKGWPIVGNLPQLGPKPHHTLHTLSKLYGPLLRLKLGSEEVVVASSSAVAAQFLRAHDADFSNRPVTSSVEHLGYSEHDLVFAPYGPRWRFLRRLCVLHLLSARALDDLLPVRANEVGLLVQRLTHAGSALDLGRAVHACVTNALARAMVGKRVFEEEGEGQGNDAAGEFKEMVVELMRIAGVFKVGDFVPWLRWLDHLQGMVGKMKRLHCRFDAFFDGIIAEHRKDKESHGQDLLSLMLGLEEKADGEGGKLTDMEIKGLLLNLFTAGTDTSSSTVEWAIAELVRHPDVLKQAQMELDFVVGRTRLVSENDLANLPFLQAVVKETLRLHPSTPLSLPRMSSKDCEINGYYIPKHATLLVNVWAIGRDPNVWSDPLEFKPSRFLPGGEHAHIDVKGNNFELIPFGAGRRVCVGISLGLRMVQFLTATLVHAFDWALPEGQLAEKLDMEEAYGVTLERSVPLTLRPLPRLAQVAYETSH